MSSSFAFTNALRCVLITPPNDPHALPGPYPSNVANSVLYLIIPVVEVDGRVAVLPTGIVNPGPRTTILLAKYAEPSTLSAYDALGAFMFTLPPSLIWNTGILELYTTSNTCAITPPFPSPEFNCFIIRAGPAID